MKSLILKGGTLLLIQKLLILPLLDAGVDPHAMTQYISPLAAAHHLDQAAEEESVRGQVQLLKIPLCLCPTHLFSLRTLLTSLQGISFVKMQGIHL